MTNHFTTATTTGNCASSFNQSIRCPPNKYTKIFLLAKISVMMIKKMINNDIDVFYYISEHLFVVYSLIWVNYIVVTLNI